MAGKKKSNQARPTQARSTQAHTPQKGAKGKAKSAAPNKTLLYILAAVLMVVVVTAAFLLRQNDLAVAGGLPKEISVSQALEKREAGAFMLDVREPSEWNEVHMEGATLIPLGELASRVDELPKDQEIVVVCRSGNRSAQGRDILLEAGFEKVTSMAGGMNEWKAAGYPVVSGP